MVQAIIYKLKTLLIKMDQLVKIKGALVEEFNKLIK